MLFSLSSWPERSLRRSAWRALSSLERAEPATAAPSSSVSTIFLSLRSESSLSILSAFSRSFSAIRPLIEPLSSILVCSLSSET